MTDYTLWTKDDLISEIKALESTIDKRVYEFIDEKWKGIYDSNVETLETILHEIAEKRISYFKEIIDSYESRKKSLFLCWTRPATKDYIIAFEQMEKQIKILEDKLKNKGSKK